MIHSAHLLNSHWTSVVSTLVQTHDVIHSNGVKPTRDLCCPADDFCHGADTNETPRDWAVVTECSETLWALSLRNNTRSQKWKAALLGPIRTFLKICLKHYQIKLVKFGVKDYVAASWQRLAAVLCCKASDISVESVSKLIGLWLNDAAFVMVCTPFGLH